MPLWRASESSVVVDAAACHHHHVGALADVEIVVNEIVDAAVRHAGGNIHRLALCAGGHTDDRGPEPSFFDSSLMLLARLTAGAAAVLAHVIRTLERAAEIRNDAQQGFCDLIHTSALSFPRGQRGDFSSASSVGRISSRGPAARTSPSAITMISSAMFRMRS